MSTTEDAMTAAMRRRLKKTESEKKPAEPVDEFEKAVPPQKVSGTY